MKKAIIFFSLAVLTSVSMFAQSSITGIWDTGDDNTMVEIIQENDAPLGKILSSDHEKAKVGTTLLKDLVKIDDVWEGKIYAPKKGKWFDVEIQPAAKQLDLKISKGFISKSFIWNRVN